MTPVFSQLFESVPDALLVVGRDGRIELANENAERLFGYASGQLSGLSVEELVPAGARERHRGHRERYMHQPRVRPMGGANMTLVGQRRDGQHFPVEIALSGLPFQRLGVPQQHQTVRGSSGFHRRLRVRLDRFPSPDSLA